MLIQSRSIDSVAGETSADAARRPESQDSTANSTTSGTQAADHASLSDASKLVSLAKTIINPIYQNKIDRLASQIRSGAYQIDPARVGQDFVQDLLHFGGSSGSAK